MDDRRDRPVSWPDRERAAAYLRFLAVFCATFFPAYVGGAALAGVVVAPFALYFEVEMSTPFVAAAIWIYLSLYPMFLVPLFQLTPPELERLARQSAVANGVAFAAFVLVPGSLGYAAPAGADGLTGFVVDLVRAHDTPHNVAPSLHVAFTVLILAACAGAARMGAKIAYLGWGALLCLSTLLVHRHHAVDVASGVALALAVRRFTPPPSFSCR